MRPKPLIKRISPRALVTQAHGGGKYEIPKKITFKHNKNNNNRKSLSSSKVVTKPSPRVSEEIVYEFEEDDIESEIKLWTMLDVNDTMENTTSSEIPSVKLNVNDSKPNEPYLYNVRSRHMHYMHRPSMSLIEKTSPGPSPTKRPKKGDILTRLKKHK